MKSLKTLKRELLADAETRAAYDTLADEFAIARELIAARAHRPVAKRSRAAHGNHPQRGGTTGKRQAPALHAHRGTLRASRGRTCRPAHRAASRLTEA